VKYVKTTKRENSPNGKSICVAGSLAYGQIDALKINYGSVI
jgi:hypothetical protein